MQSHTTGAVADAQGGARSGRPFLLEVANVTHGFRPMRGEAVGYTALEDVSFSAGEHEFISIVGPSGCGKSTLLSLISGLQRPTAGSILIEGEPVVGVRRDVGFVFQQDALLPWRTLTQNVALPLRFRGAGRAESREAAEEILSRFGLQNLGGRFPHQVSGGQRKRASIAATLIYEPTLLLMDEPFGSLDVQTRDLIEADVLREWQAFKRQTVIFVTHDLQEAIAMSDRVIVLSSGPGSHVVGAYDVDLPRPRDLWDIRTTPEFQEIHGALWTHLRDEVFRTFDVRGPGHGT
jgi:NitT/TauT family transport system ATP-binding protein